MQSVTLGTPVRPYWEIPDGMVVKLFDVVLERMHESGGVLASVTCAGESSHDLKRAIEAAFELASGAARIVLRQPIDRESQPVQPSSAFELHGTTDGRAIGVIMLGAPQLLSGRQLPQMTLSSLGVLLKKLQLTVRKGIGCDAIRLYDRALREETPEQRLLSALRSLDAATSGKERSPMGLKIAKALQDVYTDVQLVALRDVSADLIPIRNAMVHEAKLDIPDVGTKLEKIFGLLHDVLSVKLGVRPQLIAAKYVKPISA